MCLSKTVKFYALIAITALNSVSFNAIACGPSPQKVMKEITIKADAKTVWALLGHFEAMHYWHPNVKSTQITEQKDANGVPTRYRTLMLTTGEKIHEKLRDSGIASQNKKMKMGAFMESGDIPVSNYSHVISVVPGQNATESKVIWIARFNNKANAMQAPAGQDDATAIAAISQFYDAGLTHLKQRLETHTPSTK